MKNRARNKILSSFLIFVFFFSFLFSGIVQKNTNAATTFIYDNLEYKEAYGALWVKVFYHNSSNGDYFTNDAEALSCNLTNKYSILNRLDEFKVGNTYEFLLEYPKISGYNRWTQTSNPTTTIESVEGYNPISISWSDYYWKGLAKSSSKSETFIDGSVGFDYWHYSIGAKIFWPNNNLFPVNSGLGSDEVYLWMRVDGDYNLYDEYEKTTKYDSTWAKVFYHNSRNGYYWTETSISNPETLGYVARANLLTKMNSITNFFINNKYEFLLLYPELSGYNRWTQSSNPNTSTSVVYGYNPISISWSGNYFGGIARSDNTASTFFDCSPTDWNWWYAIGSYGRFLTTASGYQGIPGPNGITVSQVELYARIDGKDIIEPTINIQNYDETKIFDTIPIVIDANDSSTLSKIIINGTTYANPNNTNTFSLNYTINENGLYKIDAYDINGNIERKVLYVTNINKEQPNIGEVVVSNNEHYFLINTTLSSTIENFDKIKVCLSNEEIQNSENFVDVYEEHELSFDVLISNSNKYLNLVVVNKNGLESEVYSIKLNATFQVNFYSDGVMVSSESVPYGSSATAPSISKEGYSLIWDSSFDNITQTTTVNAIWTPIIEDSTYSIIIPKTLILDSKTKKADYVVGIKGLLEDNEVINIIPDNNFNLNDTYNIKSSVNCSVYQGEVTFDNTIINESVYYYTNGYVLAENSLSAGEWRGVFNFNISKTLIELTDLELLGIEENLINGEEEIVLDEEGNIIVDENNSIENGDIVVDENENLEPTPTPTITPIPENVDGSNDLETPTPTPTPQITPIIEDTNNKEPIIDETTIANEEPIDIIE